MNLVNSKLTIGIEYILHVYNYYINLDVSYYYRYQIIQLDFK